MTATVETPPQDLLEQIAGRASTVRMCSEAARRRGRMYLAAPYLDKLKPSEVIALMVDLLEQAPEPRTFRRCDDSPGEVRR